MGMPREREEIISDNKLLAEEAFRLRAALGGLMTVLDAILPYDDDDPKHRALLSARQRAAEVLGRGR